MPQTLSLIAQALAALTELGAAGVVVSLGIDLLRRRFPRPAPQSQPVRFSAARLLLTLLWTPATVFLLAIGLSASAGALLALLTGGDVAAALDTAIASALASQVAWFVSWVQDPAMRRPKAARPRGFTPPMSLPGGLDAGPARRRQAIDDLLGKDHRAE